MNLSNVNRVLIIRLSSLGDILLCTPLIRSIKNHNKSIKIDFLLRDEYKDTLLHNPHIDKLLYYSRDDNTKLLNRIKAAEYDLCIDLQNNLRSSRIAKAINAPVKRFHKHSFDKFLLVNFKINRLKSLPQIPVRYASTLDRFQIDSEGLELFIPEEIESSVKAEDNYIGFCPGSRHFTKMWPEEYYIELGNLLVNEGYKIVLLGGKSDREICKNIASKIPSSVDLSNDNVLLKTGQDIKNCRLVICNDSGMLHTACAVKTPVAVLFGSTVKEFGFTPYRNRNLILENNSLSCRPCSHIGRSSCPKGHFKCMLEITPSTVFNKIISMVK